MGNILGFSRVFRSSESWPETLKLLACSHAPATESHRMHTMLIAVGRDSLTNPAVDLNPMIEGMRFTCSVCMSVCVSMYRYYGYAITDSSLYNPLYNTL